MRKLVLITILVLAASMATGCKSKEEAPKTSEGEALPPSESTEGAEGEAAEAQDGEKGKETSPAKMPPAGEPFKLVFERVHPKPEQKRIETTHAILDLDGTMTVGREPAKAGKFRIESKSQRTLYIGEVDEVGRIYNGRYEINSDNSSTERFGEKADFADPLSGESFHIYRGDGKPKILGKDESELENNLLETLVPRFMHVLDPPPFEAALPEVAKSGEPMRFEGEEFLRVAKGVPGVQPGGTLELTLKSVAEDVAIFDATIDASFSPRRGMEISANWSGTFEYSVSTARLLSMTVEGRTKLKATMETPNGEVSIEAEGTGSRKETFTIE